MRKEGYVKGDSAVRMARYLIEHRSLEVRNTYTDAGVRPGVCARALRNELAAAPYALRLIVTKRDTPNSTPSAYVAGVAESVSAHPNYLAYTQEATSLDAAELIVVRRGALGSDHSIDTAQVVRKDRCPSGKVPYDSAGKAEADGARMASMSKQVPNTAYHCGHCGWWHRTSRR
jgi:hypothetical protein